MQDASCTTQQQTSLPLSCLTMTACLFDSKDIVDCNLQYNRSTNQWNSTTAQLVVFSMLLHLQSLRVCPVYLPRCRCPLPLGAEGSLHYLLRRVPICHTHVLALLSHSFKPVTCVYSVILSLQAQLRSDRGNARDSGDLGDAIATASSLEQPQTPAQPTQRTVVDP